MSGVARSAQGLGQALSLVAPQACCPFLAAGVKTEKQIQANLLCRKHGVPAAVHLCGVEGL